MSTRIRLRRMGANKRPFYRVVVADQRSPRDGRFIEIIGKYHPLEDPSLIQIDEERALHWLRVGAQPSNQVRNLMDRIGIWDKFVAERPGAAIPPKPGQAARPTKEKVSKKAAAKASDALNATKAPPAPIAEPSTVDAAAIEEAATEAAPPDAESSAEPTANEPEAEVEATSGSLEPDSAAEPAREPPAEPETAPEPPPEG